MGLRLGMCRVRVGDEVYGGKGWGKFKDKR